MNTCFTQIRKRLRKCTGYIVLSAIFLTFNGLLHAGAPPLTVTCPANVAVTAAPEECGVYFDYGTLLWSSTVPITDTVFSPPPGHFFEIGTTDVTLEATDTNNVVWTCNFTITVNDGGPFGLICNDIVPVYIGDSCWKEVTWEMILEGGPYGCPDNYVVYVLSGTGSNLGTIVDLSYVGTQWTVKVTNVLNGQSCWGSIIVKTDSLPPSITCPADTVVLCNLDDSPAITGQPLITGCIDSADLTIEFLDQRTNSYCDGDSIAWHILRTWHATDPYNNLTTCQQNIDARRAHLSEIVFPPSYDGTDLPPIACSDTTGYLISTDTSQTGVPTLAGQELHGNIVPCDLAVFFTDSITHVCGGKYIIERKWMAFDFCENDELVHVQTLLVEDDQAPDFSIPDTIWASSGTTCGVETTLPPISLAFECSDFNVEIQTPWDTLQSNGGVVNVPKAPGVFNILYTATDACDNAAADLSIMVVQEGIVSACPDDTLITCNYFNDALKDSLEAGAFGVLAPFGEPVFYNNCSFDLSETATVTVDSCGEGFIYRTITIEDPVQPEQCFQNIQVEQVSDFVVEFPADITLTCGTAPAEFGEPVITGGDCENLAVWHTDQTFTVIPDACFKILRTWYVANLCVLGDSLDQEVVELPENQLGLPYPDCDLDGDGDCDNRTFRDSWNDTAMPGVAEASNTFGPDTDDDSDPWDGYIVYEQVIKVIDDVAPVFSNNCEIAPVVIPDTLCHATVTLPVPEIEECSSISNLTARIKIDGTWENGFGPHYFLSPGDYEVEYTALDNCYNSSACTTTLSVIDPPPVAVCKNGLVVDIIFSSPPAVQVWAVDFDGGSTDNCFSNLSFSFSSNINETSIVYGCCDLGQHPITLWVTDEAGNQSSCETYVIVQSNIGCDCEPFLSGIIRTEAGDGVESVEVTIADTGYYQILTTGADGAYSFSVPAGGNYTVTPVKDNNAVNGVTTYDAVLLIKHVLNVQLLGSPYKIIAADVNKSNSVTTFDAVEMRRLILGITTGFEGNTSWRFVPTSYQFPNPANPFEQTFPETIVVNNFVEDQPGQDFTGIKIGDLNNSAIPAFAGEIHERSYTGESELILANRFLKKGEAFELPVSPGSGPLSGFQFALQFDPAKLSLKKIEPGYAGPECFGTAGLAGGLLKTSWFSATAQQRVDGPAFTLHFTAKEEGWLRDALLLDEAALAAEAYTPDLEQWRLSLTFENHGTEDAAFRLLGARPNPFGESTTLEYFLQQESGVNLTISDLSGRVIYSASKRQDAGRQEWKIGRTEIPVAGLYIYRLKCRDGWGAGKLMAE